MPYYSDTPPDQEDDPNAQDEEAYLSGTPFLDQGQAMARNDLLTQGLPAQPGSFNIPIAAPGGAMGEASREYRTGRPGLFVQGGPTIPAGMIEVNGQLERSQAAPQPVPWWITAEDQFKEQRRQEDYLNNLLSRVQASGKEGGAQAIDSARRLQAQLAIDAEVKSGTPLRDAMAKHAAQLYGPHTTPMTRLAMGTAPKQQFTPTEVTLPSGQKVTQVGPNKYAFNRQTKPGGLSPEGALRAIDMEFRHLEKQIENNPRDKELQARASARMQELTDEAKALRTGVPVAPTTSKQPNSPAAILATQLSALHPDWTKPQVEAEVRKHF